MGPIESRIGWDKDKATTNLAKHGVSFEEARDTMDDPLARDHNDQRHSFGEDRHILIGQSPRGRLLIISYAIRADHAWLISAREANGHERRLYMHKPDILADKPLDDDDIPDCSELDLAGWKPIRFPKMMGSVMLDSDVFDMFRTSEEVNEALRILIREGRVPNAPYSPAAKG